MANDFYVINMWIMSITTVIDVMHSTTEGNIMSKFLLIFDSLIKVKNRNVAIITRGN